MTYDAWGEGEALILFPGLGCDARMWGPVLDRMRSRHTALVVRVWEAVSIAEASDMGARALREKGFSRARVAGLSMGGYCAFEFLRRHPASATAAALLDTTAYPDSEERRARRLEVLDLLSRGEFEQVLAGFARSVLRRGGEHAKAREEALLAMARQLGPEAYARSVRAILEREDYTEVLKGTATPLLFLAGEEDALTPPELAARMSAEARSAQAYQIPEAAHMTAIENPGAVAYALDQFFGKH